MKFTTQLRRFDNNVYGYHLMVPDEVQEHFKQYKDLRVLFSVEGHEQVPAAIMQGKAYPYLLLNKERVKAWSLSEGLDLQVEIEKDESKYGMPMPEEFAEVLLQEPLASKFFDSLTPGKQRNFIHIVSKVKNPEKRIQKALAIAEHLIESEGQVDFKRLNELIKIYNNR